MQRHAETSHRKFITHARSPASPKNSDRAVPVYALKKWHKAEELAEATTKEAKHIEFLFTKEIKIFSIEEAF